MLSRTSRLFTSQLALNSKSLQKRGFATDVPAPDALLKKFDPARARGLPLQKPELRIHTDSGSFAHTLFAAAAERNALPQVQKDLNRIQEFIESNSQVADALANRSSSFDRESFLKELTTKAGTTDIAKKFLFFLNAEGFLDNTANVISDFQKLMQSYSHEVEGVITTAKDLSDSQVETLRNAMSTHLKKGETLKVRVEVDPSILGGLVIRIAEKTVDMSLKSEVNKIYQEMEQRIKSHFDNLSSKDPNAAATTH